MKNKQIDKQTIDNILELSKTDIKQAKQELFDYAGLFSVKLKKNMSIENMIQQLEEQTKEGEDIETTEYKEHENTTNVIEPENQISNSKASPKTDLDEVEETLQEEILEIVSVEAQTDNQPDVQDIYMFSRHLSVPYWITDWILETKDWKTTKCPWKGSEKFIRTILYYINKDKQICIRETRNSKFITLK